MCWLLAAAANIGVEPGTIIQWNGYVGMIAVAGFIIVGQINKKIGARATSAIFTILAGITYIICGNATTLPVYVIAMTLCATGMMSAGYIAGGTLVVVAWFPKRKGIVMGYTTMGHNFCIGILCRSSPFSHRREIIFSLVSLSTTLPISK